MAWCCALKTCLRCGPCIASPRLSRPKRTAKLGERGNPQFAYNTALCFGHVSVTSFSGVKRDCALGGVDGVVLCTEAVSEVLPAIPSFSLSVREPLGAPMCYALKTCPRCAPYIASRPLSRPKRSEKVGQRGSPQKLHNQNTVGPRSMKQLDMIAGCMRHICWIPRYR